ncbi:symmetrical bis(5'-nucleosyl)-tetraphosphatase [Methylophaga thiooxydans]|uniref:symmetrical bis(5'-nucleosyl)-tetraphosphatase n=1 Tax=Methylophaga thiooxydans TaxID=392484 RepID=UPI002357D526|nr:symmetrical bis(5'-nucleosyl)-tetraphosphatase [Methylophaga thiooxydans]
MAVYAIGDVQGCYDELIKMLDHIKFDPAHDQVWLAGDLVNRGPKSVEVLRFAKQLGASCISVLGNHDLHLLANAAGVVEFHHHMDTIQSVLNAPDCDELMDWLRQQPLFHHDADLQFSMVHAGLPPEWSVDEALIRAEEVETVIKSDNWRDFFAHMYGNKPKRWSPKLEGWDRLRFITNCFTRLRYCHEDGRLALKFKGAPEDKPLHQKPWFEMANRASQDDRIVFGHWSTLGVGQYGNVFSLDSGAVWGETLTAVRIDQHPYEWITVAADPAGLPHAKNKQKKSRRWL